MYFIHWESSSHPDALPFNTLEDAKRVAHIAQCRDVRDHGNYDDFKIVRHVSGEFVEVYDSIRDIVAA